ncbi:MAG: twin-arginine translocase subunit TatB [Nitrospirae bacterium]|nr:twin-arginine translocase subunit TatB [Nitrospirota bacterium]
MFDIGTQELIIIFIVALLVFGPKKLPELGRALGKGVKELKSALSGITESINETGVEEEIRKARENVTGGIMKNGKIDLGIKDVLKPEEGAAAYEKPKKEGSGAEGNG